MNHVSCTAFLCTEAAVDTPRRLPVPIDTTRRGLLRMRVA